MDAPSAPHRTIGFWSATALVIASMLGAADGYLPSWLAQRSGPPRLSIAFQFAIALIMLWTSSYMALLTFIGFTLSLSTAATVLGLVLLRRQLGPALHVSGWPWVPLTFIAAVLVTTTLSISRSPLPSLAGFAVIGLGWAAWHLSRRPG